MKAYEAPASGEKEFSPPFYIVRDHRRALKLRRQRETRKKKAQKEREIELTAAREEKQSRIRQINKSMLEADDVWNLLNDDMKVDDSEQSFTHDVESNINKRIQQIRLEVLFTLHQVEKAPLFAERFPAFEFMEC
jgi:hypothetical protein